MGKDWYTQKEISIDTTDSGPCFCIGRQNGEPFCPCVMKRTRVRKEGNEWVIPERRIPVRGK